MNVFVYYRPGYENIKLIVTAEYQIKFKFV